MERYTYFDGGKWRLKIGDDGDCLSCEPAACACDWRVFVHSGGQRRKKCVRGKTSERSI